MLKTKKIILSSFTQYIYYLNHPTKKGIIYDFYTFMGGSLLGLY